MRKNLYESCSFAALISRYTHESSALEPSTIESLVRQRGYVHGYAKTSSGTAISGVTIQVTGGMVSFNKKVTTDKYGFYSSGLVSIGNYTVSASKPGYTTQSKSAVVNNGTTTTVSFTF